MEYNTISRVKAQANQSKECKKIIKKIRSGNVKLSKPPLYTSSMRIFTNDIYKAGGQIDQVLGSKSKPISKSISLFNKYILANRIKNFYVLHTHLSQLKEDECLEQKTFGNGVTGYTIRNIINLQKRIGSKSRYGYIFLTSINATPKSPLLVATKIMKYNVNNIDEVYIMNMITNNVLLKSLSRHFLMIYGSCVCSKRIAKKLKLISINELADGDLKMLTGMSDVLGDTELMFNLFIQTYISIATFQNLVGFTHRDTHFGNFLYQQNNEKGYYHYIFKGDDYYLKSCKYNIMIYDYGFARKIKVNEENEYDEEAITKKKNDIYDDYRKIIFSFITKKNGGWIKTSNIPSYKYANYKMIEIGNILDKYFDYELTYNIEYSTDDFTSLLFTHIIDNVFLKYAPKNLFITQRPPNVINAIPFRID